MVYQMGTDDVISFRAGIVRIKVRCESGFVWVTTQGDSRDHFLREGRELTVRGWGKTVVMALENSSVLLYRSVAARPGRCLPGFQAPCRSGSGA